MGGAQCAMGRNATDCDMRNDFQGSRPTYRQREEEEKGGVGTHAHAHDKRESGREREREISFGTIRLV